MGSVIRQTQVRPFVVLPHLRSVRHRNPRGTHGSLRGMAHGLTLVALSPAVSTGGLRIVASGVVSIALTVALMSVARANHAPACATPLIVSLGVLPGLVDEALIMAAVTGMFLTHRLVIRRPGEAGPLANFCAKEPRINNCHSEAQRLDSYVPSLWDPGRHDQGKDPVNRKQVRLFVREVAMRRKMSFQCPSLAMAVVAVFVFLSAVGRAAIPPKYDHVIIIFEENKDYAQVIGSANAPYVNKTLLGVYGGALFTNMHAETHPSQANYIAFFSGWNQGVTDDRKHDLPPMTTPNLGASLLARGYSVALPRGTATDERDIPSIARCSWLAA